MTPSSNICLLGIDVSDATPAPHIFAKLDGSFSREELFAMGSIPLLGADKDSDLSLSNVDDVDNVGGEDE